MHNYSINVWKINYYVNTILVITQRKETLLKVNGKTDTIYEFSNFYVRLPLGESLGSNKPKYIGDGEIMNAYMSIRTSSLILEMFSVKKMKDEELIQEQGRVMDSLFFARWVYRDVRDDFELSEYLSIDYTGITKPNAPLFFYSEIKTYDVVKLEFLNLFIFKTLEYASLSDWKNSRLSSGVEK